MRCLLFMCSIIVSFFVFSWQKLEWHAGGTRVARRGYMRADGVRGDAGVTGVVKGT